MTASIPSQLSPRSRVRRAPASSHDLIVRGSSARLVGPAAAPGDPLPGAHAAAPRRQPRGRGRPECGSRPASPGVPAGDAPDRPLHPAALRPGVDASLQDYDSHFSGWRGEPYRLETSPVYFDGGPRLVTEVAAAMPEAQVVLLLRDPALRLWTSFTDKVRRGRLPEAMPFDRFVDRCLALRANGSDRFEGNRYYRTLSSGFYVEHLAAWSDAFRGRLHIVFAEHVAADPEARARPAARPARPRPRGAGAGGAAGTRPRAHACPRSFWLQPLLAVDAAGVGAAAWRPHRRAPRRPPTGRAAAQPRSWALLAGEPGAGGVPARPGRDAAARLAARRLTRRRPPGPPAASHSFRPLPGGGSVPLCTRSGRCRSAQLAFRPLPVAFVASLAFRPLPVASLAFRPLLPVPEPEIEAGTRATWSRRSSSAFRSVLRLGGRRPRRASSDVDGPCVVHKRCLPSHRPQGRRHPCCSAMTSRMLPACAAPTRTSH